MPSDQTSLFQNEPAEAVALYLEQLTKGTFRPGAAEIVRDVRAKLGDEAAWQLPSMSASLGNHPNLREIDRGYFRALAAGGELMQELREPTPPAAEIATSIDTLLRTSQTYRNSTAFQEMIDFMGRFRDYSPYNCMLVRIQNPGCAFFATEKHWEKEFGRTLKEDARPLIILAPMHPVLLVYDLDQTEGEPVPEKLRDFAKFEGKFDERWLSRAIDNAAKYRIRVDIKPLTSVLAGFATVVRGSAQWKMRVAIHEGHDPASRLGVLAHELAHILLGHLGSDYDLWWPSRANVGHAAMEIEAEAVAYIVSERLGLKGTSAAYVSSHLKAGEVPPGVSIDLIGKTAGLILRMAQEALQAPKPRPVPKKAAKT